MGENDLGKLLASDRVMPQVSCPNVAPQAHAAKWCGLGPPAMARSGLDRTSALALVGEALGGLCEEKN
jgi:hypothetical protein